MRIRLSDLKELKTKLECEQMPEVANYVAVCAFFDKYKVKEILHEPTSPLLILQVLRAALIRNTELKKREKHLECMLSQNGIKDPGMWKTEDNGDWTQGLGYLKDKQF